MLIIIISVEKMSSLHQGIVGKATVDLWEFSPLRLILQVHDEILSQGPGKVA